METFVQPTFYFMENSNRLTMLVFSSKSQLSNQSLLSVDFPSRCLRVYGNNLGLSEETLPQVEKSLSTSTLLGGGVR